MNQPVFNTTSTSTRILLSGPVGCGKNNDHESDEAPPATEHKFSIKPCNISFEFIQDGYAIIHKYSRVNCMNQTQKQFALMI
jgi:hypothetical protein